MKVRDYVSDMIIGQKWAVEVCFFVTSPNEYESDEVEDYMTFHYQEGQPYKCDWFDNEVLYFRVIANEIVLCVNQQARLPV